MWASPGKFGSTTESEQKLVDVMMTCARRCGQHIDDWTAMVYDRADWAAITDAFAAAGSWHGRAKRDNSVACAFAQLQVRDAPRV